MEFFTRAVKGLPEFKKWKSAVESKGNENYFTGLSSSAKAHFAYLFSDENKIVYIAANELEATSRYSDFCFFCGDRVVYLPAREDVLYDVEARGRDGNFQRMMSLKKLMEGDWQILVMPLQAAMQYLPSPDMLKGQILSIEQGQNYDIVKLAERLTAMGYQRVSSVEGRGQFSLRGYILDVFPSSADVPYRVEFFDTEVDSIRSFDVVSQRTIEGTDTVEVLPDSETNIFSVETELKIRKRILDAADDFTRGQTLKENASNVRALMRKIEADLNLMSSGHKFPGYDRYLPFILGTDFNVFSYTKEALVFFDRHGALKETENFLLDEHRRVCESVAERIPLLPQCFDMLMPFEQVACCAKKVSPAISFMELFSPGILADRGRQQEFIVPVKIAEPFPKGVEESSVGKILVLTETESKANRALEYLKDHGFSDAVFCGDRHCKDFHVGVAVGGLENGFVYPTAGVSVISGKSFFKKERAEKKRKKKSNPITSFADIKPGDFVVHEIHGIGKFDGIETIESQGVRKDYVKILYADDGVVYVPTYQLEIVQKYIGAEGKVPKVNKMGGAEWSRTTAKIKDSLREYAQELVDLYAKRSKVKGHAFSEDTVWQKEFEEGFIYEETEDQLKCVEEIKADMELPRPMERLLCGDVGYGKTEVALRAAFKAVCDGKQVAFLCPTTVLAQQHYQNFVQRFKDFPVTVDYLCRFRTPKERTQVLKNTASGKIDILVGTHSILQKKLDFKNLGLVIIDEEQRFGVMHKEKLKQSRPDVDILSLSATPIPRTLHMSLSGIRDISILEEPPVDRKPVQTFVTELTPDIVKNAIYREMGRKGQVFYLYNRVRTILEKKMWLNTIVPEARVAVAHGQMSERELEDTMAAFQAGEYDVLLCTTIIESGLDLPNANTVIVEDGDRLGLAQMYQIRGRVGRSSRTAYAYITYKKDKNISEIAEKRLQTIREFTEFGSGFKIALRDLEIRGAGSVLGEQQHGQLAVVGYDMYCKLLSQVVAEAGGQTLTEIPEVTVGLDVSAFVPSEYVEDDEVRVDIYRKIAAITSREDIYDLTDELIDRFGDVPKEVQSLMEVSYIRYIAGICGFSDVFTKNNRLIFVFHKNSRITENEFLPEIMDLYKGKILLNAGTDPYLSLEVKGTVLKEAKEFLDNCVKRKQ